MHNLHIKFAKAQNFLPFGPEGIEIDFTKYKNIVIIRGQNKDAKNIEFNQEDFKNHSNGTGKSSVQEIIVWGLFGKTVKRPDKLNSDDVIHNKVGKDCCVELLFNDYRLIRTRKKNSLRLWQSSESIWNKETEITQGTMSATQQKVEEIIKMSYDTFISMCIFTDDQRGTFLEADNPKKKEIVENLLSLNEYTSWLDQAKSLKKEIKQKIDIKLKEYQMLSLNKDEAENRLKATKQKQKDWIANKKLEIESLEAKIAEKQKQLEETDDGAALIEYQKAQELIQKINVKLDELEKSKESIQKDLELCAEKDQEFKEKAQSLVKRFSDFQSAIKIKIAEKNQLDTQIQNLKTNKPGTKCDKCRSLVEQENIDAYVNDLEKQISEITLQILCIKESLELVGKESEEHKLRQTNLANAIKIRNEKNAVIDQQMRQLRIKLTEASKVKEPKVDNATLLIEQECKDLQSRIEEKTTELESKSPFEDLIENGKIDCENGQKNLDEKNTEIKELEKELPYYDYWISGFGDNGIRKWIIDGIIPELNNRVNYWLQFLIDNQIILKFNNELDERIERNPPDGDPYVYFAMSSGQKRRLNLAVSQAFANVMMTTVGSSPSIVFLDEVSINIDTPGIVGIYNMICELAETKQVFVTTHSHELQSLLDGADVLSLVHENGYTKMAS